MVDIYANKWFSNFSALKWCKNDNGASLRFKIESIKNLYELGW